ncbi:MAG TPA: methionine synthase [Actinopolymorphaceae bacterium]
MTSQSLRTALAHRVVVADGAMGTMLQGYDLGLADFDGLEGCNEVLNATRPDVVTAIHEAYFAAGSDAVETNTFGANLGNLGEYDIVHRIGELSLAGAQLASSVAKRLSTPERPRWVLGSVGPGTKLPSLGQATLAQLRDAYLEQIRAMIAGGVDAVLIETVQDLLQAKSAVLAARRAIDEQSRDIPLIVNVTVETTGTMLMGSEIGAALTSLEPLGIDMIGLNCATGPAEMSEHLRHLSRHASVQISCMPNAGLPQLTAAGAQYPLTAYQLADAQERFVRDYGVGLVGGCCGTTPEHIRVLSQRMAGLTPTSRTPEVNRGVSSLYQHVDFGQDTSYLSIGERTNANGSKAFREAMLAGKWDDCVQIARGQTRDGAHVLDLCVDYVGRDGAADMREVASRLATASTLPIVLDSTEPNVLEAGLQALAGRSIINSVNFEDGDGPESRYARTMALVREYGSAVIALTIDEAGQARTAEHKVAIATRLIEALTRDWGMNIGDILIDCLTFTIATGQEESRRDGLETIAAIRLLKEKFPPVRTTLGLSNISFGLSPASRVVLNSVFLHECVQAGLDSAIVHTAKILPMNRIPDDQRQIALDLIYDRRRTAEHPDGEYDPLVAFLEIFAGVTSADTKASRAAELLLLPVSERLGRRIIDGERKGLEGDLDEALTTKPALQIINDDLLAGMRTVGELFGSGQMQLPFVLQSAEVMKASVAYLEPHMEKADDAGKGTIVLATVKGDVHDIGKNLVDIILSNNGYRVVNLGIKQPINAIIDAAQEHKADAIGMSGLLVKSTVVMRENLEELSSRGLATTWPILLGGAALTRAYVEQDLAGMFAGEVRYARDAFEGLKLMDAVRAVQKGEPGAALPELRKRRVPAKVGATVGGGNGGGAGSGSDAGAPSGAGAVVPEPIRRSDVATDNPVPAPPFWGSRIIKGVGLNEFAGYLDERATFMGQWGLRSSRGDGPSYEELVETEGRPRLRSWLDRIATDGLAQASLVYGYWPAVSEGNSLLVLDPSNPDPDRPIKSFTFPRQRRDRRLCLADFFRPKSSGELDVVAFQLVTMGPAMSVATAALFEQHAYRDYLELHGLSVQLAEALAEYWHSRIRADYGYAAEDPADVADLFDVGYRGCRYSFGYPACPDLDDRRVIVDLLEAERIGVELSEEFQLHPEQSTDALIVHHPEANYFNAR